MKHPAKGAVRPVDEGYTDMSASDPAHAISPTRTHLITCLQCDIEVEAKSDKKKFCSDKCRKKYARSYNAGSITYHEEKFSPVFDWKTAEDWAVKYNTHVDWLKRGILACREVGKSPGYIEDRYLKKLDIPMDMEVDKARRES